MKIDWILSPEKLQEAKRINELHKTMTYSQIAKALGKHRVTVTEMNLYYRKYVLGEKFDNADKFRSNGSKTAPTEMEVEGSK